MKTKLLAFTLIPLLLVSCKGKGPSTDIGKKYENLSASYICEGGSYGEWFTEVNGGRFLATDSTYVFTFTSSYTKDTSFTVQSSHKDHVTVEQSSGSLFRLHTHSAGDSIITIYNAQGALTYRNVIRVRPAQNEKSLEQLLCNTEYYKTIPELVSFTGDWKFSATKGSDGTLEGVVSGSDEYGNAKCEFDMEYVEYYAGRDYHIYKAVDAVTTNKTTIVSSVCVSNPGDMAYIYYKDGEEEHLLAITYNIDVDYVYTTAA